MHSIHTCRHKPSIPFIYAINYYNLYYLHTAANTADKHHTAAAQQQYIYPLIGTTPLHQPTHATQSIHHQLFHSTIWSLHSIYHIGLLKSNKQPRHTILPNIPVQQHNRTNTNDSIDSNKQYIVLLGRSNVGKSSIINKLLNSTHKNNKLAYTSSTPGKTQQIYQYIPSNKYNLVISDLPGYGYGKSNISHVISWNKLLQQYIQQLSTTINHATNQSLIACVYILIDSRRGIQSIDQQYIQYIQSLNSNVPYHIVLTKTDKLKPYELDQLIHGIRLQLTDEFYSNCIPQLIVTSTVNNTGINELRTSIIHMCRYNK